MFVQNTQFVMYDDMFMGNLKLKKKSFIITIIFFVCTHLRDTVVHRKIKFYSPA